MTIKEFEKLFKVFSSELLKDKKCGSFIKDFIENRDWIFGKKWKKHFDALRIALKEVHTAYREKFPRGKHYWNLQQNIFVIAACFVNPDWKREILLNKSNEPLKKYAFGSVYEMTCILMDRLRKMID